jgi:hypothetical protein
MANRYILTDEVKEKFLPIVQDLINQVESYNGDNKNSPEVDLSGTEINPYTLRKLLEDIGYKESEDEDMETNGWQMDFWIYMYKPGYKPLTISGCGITFDLKLHMKDID